MLKTDDWQRVQESNLQQRNQNPWLYHLTNPQQENKSLEQANQIFGHATSAIQGIEPRSFFEQ